MNLLTLEVTEEEARAKLDEYKTALESERTAEDEAIAAGYRAAARGLPVILLSHVMSAGGWFDNGLPRLAIARADATQCWVSVGGHMADERTLMFRDTEFATNLGALVGRHTVRVQVPAPIGGRRSQWRGHTTVPLIPPRHRPKRGRLRTHHVLWEVEAWDPTPPRDPALVRHIRGDLWAVVATWDLTDLERAVLSQRS